MTSTVRNPVRSEVAVVRIGLDATSVPRWRQRLRRSPALPRITFTANERDWAERLVGDPAPRYATVWAAKESVVKAAALGFDGLSWRDVEIDPVHGRGAVTGCPTPWRVRWTHRCSRAVALAWDPGAPAEVATAGRLVSAPCRYADRSVAVRALAERTLRRRCAGVRDVQWGLAASGAPLLRADGVPVAVSLTHGDGLLGAAVAMPHTDGGFNQND
jgi:phosphopantetheinyl transferase (holo-ACP synthase)